MSRWSDEDKQVLQNSYPTTSAKELSDVLERSEAAIHSKASRLGIDKQSPDSRESVCDSCGEQYQHGGDLSWNHTSVCRACYDRQRRKDRKWRVVNELFDGVCEKCGYSECLQALTLHHRNPDDKEINLSNMIRHSWDTVVSESEKCDLLCANCHNQLHCAECVNVAE